MKTQTSTFAALILAIAISLMSGTMTIAQDNPSDLHKDSDGDGVSIAQGDCYDSVDIIDAAWCQTPSSGEVFLYTVSGLKKSQYPECPGTFIAYTDASSALTGPQMTHDNIYDSFDNDCDKSVDEGGTDECWYLAVSSSEESSSYAVFCPFMKSLTFK